MFCLDAFGLGVSVVGAVTSSSELSGISSTSWSVSLVSDRTMGSSYELLPCILDGETGVAWLTVRAVRSTNWRAVRDAGFEVEAETESEAFAVVEVC